MCPRKIFDCDSKLKRPQKSKESYNFLLKELKRHYKLKKEQPERILMINTKKPDISVNNVHPQTGYYKISAKDLKTLLTEEDYCGGKFRF